MANGIGEDLGDRPSNYDGSSGAGPVNLRIAYEIKDGFYEGKEPHALVEDRSKWVLSAIHDGDEWLERVGHSQVPEIAKGSYVHVIEGKHFATWLSSYAVVVRRRDNGRLVERSVRRVAVDGESVRLRGLPYPERPYTLEDLVLGRYPEYGHIVGVVVRGYSFFMAGTMWDDIPF